ncbi:MAG: ATP-binding cassette domain-containing protein [Coprococcus sp.]|nr:ATP-binding cassette domain-containing protein [Coprococcus sp.]
MNIEIKHVTKVIKKTKVIDNVNFTFEGGKIYGLSGKNGCGKTMLMRLISGLIYPTDGEIVIDGKILGKDCSFPESIGLLIENPAFLDEYTAYENLKMLNGIGGKKIDKEGIAQLLNSVGLDPLDNRKYYKFSLGMRQRLGIAAAIMGEPDIILLDEPINAIDAEGVSDIRDLIRGLRDEGRVIIIACHDKEEMEYMADEIIYLKSGKIVKGDEV